MRVKSSGLYASVRDVLGVYFGSGLTNHKHMLISQDMLTTHQKNLVTYQRMLIGQDMLTANMLIARFNCTEIWGWAFAGGERLAGIWSSEGRLDTILFLFLSTWPHLQIRVQRPSVHARKTQRPLI
jgi:hypothetical protein